MFRWFERRLDPFPTEDPAQPPRGLLAFCVHYTRGAWPFLVISALLTASVAITEVWLFSFLGNIVDWLSHQDRSTFIQNEGWKLAGMFLVVMVLLPLLVLTSSLFNFQTLMGNYPMRIRWLVHRYLLRQSMSFFQDEFAGRIATKVMQTALAVRECVIKLIDVLNYVAVYFVGTVLVVGLADWRLMLPLLGWALGYTLMMRHFIPRLGKVAEEQADARSVMTGGIVDAYTNIQTVKLFSHAQREARHAREGMTEFMTTVYRQMRLVTLVNVSLYLLNGLLLASVTGLALWLWLEPLALLREYQARSEQFADALIIHLALVGAAVAASLILAIVGVLAMRRCSGLQRPGFAVLNFLQTIPSLALFGLLLAPLAWLGSQVAWLGALGVSGIGWAPAFLALLGYSLLPMVRNLHVALDAVDPAVIEAARGMGMSRRQVLLQARLPLALPVVVEGLRITTIQAIGLTAVAALIGAGGLGTFIFQGLGQAAMDMVLLGALPIIVLALVTDALFGTLSEWLRPGREL